MYQNIADTEISASEAAGTIIAMTKAFSNEGLTAIQTIDKINEVANRFAVSSADIATALPKVASTLSLAGNSSSESIGLLVAATELMPNQASRVARGMRSITLNLQGMTAEGNKSLELTAKMEKSFSKIGMTLTDETTGGLKSTYQILKELSVKWKDLTPDQQKYYAALIGGKQQVDVVTATLKNFSAATGATETAMNSAGSAARENEKYMKGIEGRIAGFTTEFQKLSQQLINSDLIKNTVSFGTGLLRMLTASDALIPKLALLSTTIWGVSKAIILLNTKAIPSLLGKGSKLLTWLQKIPTAFAMASANGMGFKKVLDLMGMSKGMIGALPWLGLAGAIIGVAVALDKNIKSLKENSEQYKKNKDRIVEIDDALDKLYKKQKDGTITEVEERRIRMYEIERDLLIEQDKLLRNKIDKQVLLNQKIAIQNGLTGKTESYSKSDLKINEYETAVNNYNRALILSEQAYNNYVEAKKNGDKELADSEYAKYEKYKDVAGKTKTQYLEALQSLSDMKTSIETLYEGREDEMPAQVKAILNAIDDTIDKSKNFEEAWANLSNSIIGGDSKKIVKSLKTIGDQLEIGFNNKTMTYNLENLKSELENIGMSKDDIAGVVNELSNAGYKWTDTETTATDILTALGIISEYPELEPSVDNSELEKTWGWLDSIKKLWDKLFGADGSVGSPIHATPHAKGTKNAGNEIAEVNEEGFELIRDKNGVRIAGGGERTVTKLNQGDEVIPHDESIAMLRGDNDIKLQGFASGTHSISTKVPTRGHYRDESTKGFEKTKDALDHRLAMGLISEQTYYEKLMKLRNKYYKAGKISLEDSRRIEEEVHDYNEKLKEEAAEKEKERKEKAFDDEVKRLEKLQEKYSAQQELLNIYAEKQIENIDKKIEGYEKEKEELQKQNEASERANSLTEASIKLAEAKSKKVKVYRAGQGFVYESDQGAVDEAQKELDALKAQYKLEDALAKIDAKIATAEEEKAKWSDVASSWQEEQDIKNLEQVAGITMSSLNTSIGGSLSTFDKMYSSTGAKAEGYTDALALTEDTGKIQSTSTINSLIADNKHANGTLSAHGGLSLVGERGAELRVLGRGDGIMPNDITKNLMDIGRFNAKELINAGSMISKTASSNKTEFNFGAGSIVVNGDNAENLARDIINNMNRIVQQSEKQRN